MKRANIIHDREWSDAQPFLNCYMDSKSTNSKHHITAWNKKNSDLEKRGVAYHSFKISLWPHPQADAGRRSVVIDKDEALEKSAEFLVIDYRGGNGGLIEPAASLEWARLYKGLCRKSIFKLN